MVTNCGRRGVAMGDSSDELTDDPATSFVPKGGVIHLSRSQYVLYRYMQSFLPPARAVPHVWPCGRRTLATALNELLSASPSIVKGDPVSLSSWHPAASKRPTQMRCST
jgi:hypothetical protein